MTLSGRWEEWEEGEEEPGAYEYVAYHHEGEGGKEEAHIEPAVLYQPLSEATLGDEATTSQRESAEAAHIGSLEDQGKRRDVGGAAPHCHSRRACRRKVKQLRKGGQHGEVQEWCELVGGGIGGGLGTPGGPWTAGAGTGAGTVAGKELCKE